MHKTSPSKIWRRSTNRYTHGCPGEVLTGTLVTWSVVHAAPEGFDDQTPYVIGIVQTGEDRLTAQIVDCEPDALRAGQELVSTFRKISQDGNSGLIHYGLKWMPLRSAS